MNFRNFIMFHVFSIILIQAPGRPLQRSPIYGKPTPDDQVLVDETASAARPLVTEYVSSPQLNKTGKLDVESTGSQHLVLFIHMRYSCQKYVVFAKIKYPSIHPSIHPSI